MDMWFETSTTLKFTDTADFSETKAITSIFNKLEKSLQKIGYKKDYSEDEVEMIRAIKETLNSQYGDTAITEAKK